MISAPMVRECWNLRGFVLASVRRDFASRYLGTKLGFFWAVAQPLAMILIYTLVFAQIMRPSLPGHSGVFAYSIFLCAGIIVWILFSELLTRSTDIFVANAGLLTKVSIPKLVLPAIASLTAFANFAVIGTLFFGFLLLSGNAPGVAVVLALPAVVLAAVLALGLGLTMGIVNVFYRDVGQAAGMVLQFWFWLTPIVYPARALPDWIAALISWNPVAPITHFVQTAFLENRVPAWSTLAYPATVAAASVALGLVAYRRLGGEIPDEL